MTGNRWTTSAFAIHDRSLIVFRTLLGLLSVDALFQNWGHLEAMIGRHGIFPGELAANWAFSPFFPLYFWADGGAGLHVLYAIHLAVAVAFTFGYFLRFTAPALWFLTVCFQCRAEVWLTGFNEYQRLLLFWSMFLPLTSAKWDKPRTLASPASAAMLIQIGLVYVMSGALKTGPEWKWPGSAISVVLSLEPLALPLGQWLRHFPRLLGVTTVMVPWIEILGGVLLFAPRREVRWGAIGILALLHVAIGLTFFTGLFPWICIAALTLFWQPTSGEKEWNLGRWRYFPAAALTGVVLWNVAFFGGADLSARWRRPLYWLRLDQYWYTFSPSPAKQTVWLTASAMYRGAGARSWLETHNRLTEDGYKVIPASLLSSVHWIEFSYRLPPSSSDTLRDVLARYLCRRSEVAGAPARVLNLGLAVKDETTGQRDDVAWLHDCRESEPR